MAISRQAMAELQRKAREELARRRGEYKPKLAITLSPEQAAFIADPSLRKVARCGRRAGKTMTMVYYFIQTMLNKPNARCLYLSLTREQSKEIVWGPMLELLSAAGIRHVASKSELKITITNGSFLRLFGADSERAKNRLLGQPWDLVGVDEVGYVKEVDELVTRVIEPSLMDYGGTICLTSSPPAAFHGLFYEADQGRMKKHWSQHFWDIRSNPFFAGRADKLLEDVIATKFGGNPDHPTYRREYLGQWVAESSDRVYPVSNRNLIESPLPAPSNVASWTVVGLDLGLRDPNSISVLRAREDSREVEELYSWKKNNMTVDELAAKLIQVSQEFNPISIEADTGGFGLGVVNELRKRYSLNISAAEKKDKLHFQEFLRSDILSGYCKFLKDSLTYQEMQLLVRNSDGIEDPRCENHCSDAYLYAWRKVYNYHIKNYKAPKTVEEKIIEHVTIANTVKDKSGNWWD